MPISESNKQSFGWIWPLGGAILGMVLVLWAFYPGYMSPDSVDQLHQARGVIYSNWHPPIMAGIWSLTDKLFPGPQGMLLFYNLLFWSGLAIILYYTRLPGPIKLVFALAIGAIPPVAAYLGVIWKDVGVGTCLVFATAMLLLANKKRSLLPLLPAFLAMSVAYSMRHNVAPAILPLAFWLVWIGIDLIRPKGFKIRYFVLLTLLIFGTFQLLSKLSDVALVTGNRAYPFQIVQIHDLMAISMKLQTLVLPPHLQKSNPPWNLENLGKIFYSFTSVPAFWGDSSARRIELSSDSAQMKELTRFWKNKIFSYPLIYLQHRVDVFKNLLGIGTPAVDYPYQKTMVENPFGYQIRRSWLNSLAESYLEIFEHSLFFRGWAYLVLAVLLLLLGFAKKNYPTCLLSLSGILYASAYLIVAPAGDFRFLWWTVLSVYLSLLFLLIEIEPPKILASGEQR